MPTGRYASWIDEMEANASYCARLAPGTPLDLILHPATRAVVIIHEGRAIGRIPAAHGWVAERLAARSQVTCHVHAVANVGWPRRRARRVDLEVDVVAPPALLQSIATRVGSGGTYAISALSDAGGWIASGAADIGRTAIERGGQYGGKAARWTGATLVAAPARAIVAGIDGVADRAVRRPYRRLKRMLLIAILTVFAALILILLIVVIWRMPSFGPLLGGIGR